jgi:hypothetical protein
MFSRNTIVPVRVWFKDFSLRISLQLQPNLDHHNVERTKCARGNGRLTCQILYGDVDASKSLNLVSRTRILVVRWRHSHGHNYLKLKLTDTRQLGKEEVVDRGSFHVTCAV